MLVLKRILLAIVVLPFSFVVVGFLAALLIGVFLAMFDFMHLDASELFRNPTDFAAKAQVAWQDVEAQYSKDPVLFTNTVSDAAQLSFKKHLSTVEALAAIYASLAAIIFFLSCLAYTLYVSLLTSRRIVTVPLVFSYIFIILTTILFLIVDFISIIIVRTASVPGEEIKNVMQFHTSYDGEVLLGVAIVTLIFAIYFSYRLIGWDGLPWCRTPLPVEPQRRSRPKP